MDNEFNLYDKVITEESTNEDVLEFVNYLNLLENNGEQVENSQLVESEYFMLNNAVMFLFEPSLNGRIIYANSKATEFYGYTHNEMESLNVSEINSFTPLEISREMRNARKFGRNFFQFIHKLKNGELRNVVSYLSPILINGKILIYSIVHDITDRMIAQDSLKQANADLINSNNLISQQLVRLTSLYNKTQESENRLANLNSSKDIFFSVIAHDLKSPIAGFLDTLKMLSANFSQMTIATIREYTGTLYESAENLYNFLENLLNWSRIQRGNFRFYYSDYCLNDIIEQNLKIINRNAHLKNIRILNEIQDDAFVYSDENMLSSIIGNIIFNSVKYTNCGGIIKVSCSDFDDRLYLITVEDNGIGIDDGLKNDIFKIDKRTIRLGTNNELGSGLGLILTKDFVEKCGGNIWFDSEAGKYTKFHFTIMKSSIINE